MVVMGLCKGCGCIVAQPCGGMQRRYAYADQVRKNQCIPALKAGYSES
jgi:hypothetical protein